MKYPPDEIVVIHDNAECVRLLTEHGLLDVLTTPEPPYTKCHVHFNTDTHWCQAIYFSGYRQQHDNGFVITLLPKSGFCEPLAQGWFASVIVDLSGGEVALVTANIDPVRN